MEGIKYQRFTWNSQNYEKKIDLSNSDNFTTGVITVVDQQILVVQTQMNQNQQCHCLIKEEYDLVFDIEKNKFTTIRLHENNKATTKFPQIKNEKERQWKESSFQTFFFRQIQELCLVEEENKENKLKITSFQVSLESQFSLIQIGSQSLTNGEWKKQASIYKVNEQGLIGWCSTSADYVNLTLFSRKNGYKLLTTTENPFGYELKIQSIGQSISNFIHICFSNPSKEEELPILILQTINDFSQIKDARTAKEKSGKTKISGNITLAMNIGDFFLIDVEIKGKKLHYIYSFETESLEFNKTLFDGKYQLAKVYYGKNNYLCYQYLKDLQQLSVERCQLIKNNSLSTLKMIESIHQIHKASQSLDTAVLIFGAHMSGKTTLRHFLAGNDGDLEHVQHQGGYPVVRLVDDYQKKYSTNPEKGQLISTTLTQRALLIEIPEFQNQLPFFEMEICIAMQQIFKKFKKIHTVITIPFQFIEQSEKNVSLFASVLKMLQLDHTDISSSMTIVLTKIEDEEEAQEMFVDRIEQMIEVNMEIGKIVNRINEHSKIYTFKNEQPDASIGNQILANILDSDSFPLEGKMAEKIKEKILGEGKTDSLLLVRIQIDEYFQLMNKVLLYFTSLIVKEPKFFSMHDFSNDYILIQGETLNKLVEKFEQNPKKLIPIIFDLIAILKLFLENKQERNEKQLTALNKKWQQLSQEYLLLTDQGSNSVLKFIIDCFMTSLLLSHQNLKIQQQEEDYTAFIETIKSYPYSIFQKKFRSVMQKLCDAMPELKSSPLMSSIKPYMTASANRVVIKTQIVPMSYNEQKSLYLKQDNQLQVIVNLPSNTMKLDLMIQQLLVLGKEQITDKNMKEVRYYLRQCSRICQFHKQYLEALIFLMVIPDFYGINLLLDDLVEYRKQTNTYENKLLLSAPENELIGELIVLARSRVRDCLVKKLIQIQTLHAEASKKASVLRNEEKQKLIQNLSSDRYECYANELREKKVVFFNMKNETYKKMLTNRNHLIERSRQFEEGSRAFQDIQALDWVVSNTPIPI